MKNSSRPLDLTEGVCDGSNVSRIVDILIAKIRSKAQTRIIPFVGEVVGSNGKVLHLDESSIQELGLLTDAKNVLVKLLTSDDEISASELDIMLLLMKNQDIDQIFRELAFYLRQNHQSGNDHVLNGKVIVPFDYKNIRNRIMVKLRNQTKAMFEWSQKNVKNFSTQIFVVTPLGVYLNGNGTLYPLDHTPDDMDVELSGKVEIAGVPYFVFVERDNDGQSPGYFLSYYDSIGIKVSPTLKYKGEDREVCFMGDEFGVLHVYPRSWVHTHWVKSKGDSIGELNLKNGTVELSGWRNIFKQPVPLEMQKK